MKTVLLVALGGALGSTSRYLVNLSAIMFLSSTFPFGTLLVNVSGSFLISFLHIIFINRLIDTSWWQPLLILGFLGGFTTFSSFSLETLTLFNQGSTGKAILNISANVILSLLGVCLGTIIGEKI